MASRSQNMQPNKTSARVMTPQTEFPIQALSSALRIAGALWDNFAGKGAPPHSIALALEMSPTSGSWRNLCGSSIAYGLTEGGYNAGEITLSELGRRIVAPLEEGEEKSAKIDAVLKPRIMGEFLRRYDKAKFPKDEIARNVLVDLGLPKDRATSALGVLKTNGSDTGIVIDTKTGPFVALAVSQEFKPGVGPPRVPGLSGDSAKDSASAAVEGEMPPPRDEGTPESIVEQNKPKKIFVAHGKNRKPLDDLKNILNQFKIPYVVAVDEPHAGRPISKKVAGLMRECSAGIFIFTRDERFQRADGEDVWRPSENVVYELGAASVLWENKIIIMKEAGVNFPSDFSDLGYITFEEGAIAAKALDLLKELIGLQFVKVQAA